MPLPCNKTARPWKKRDMALTVAPGVLLVVTWRDRYEGMLTAAWTAPREEWRKERRSRPMVSQYRAWPRADLCWRHFSCFHGGPGPTHSTVLAQRQYFFKLLDCQVKEAILTLTQKIRHTLRSSPVSLAGSSWSLRARGSPRAGSCAGSRGKALC